MGLMLGVLALLLLVVPIGQASAKQPLRGQHDYWFVNRFVENSLLRWLCLFGFLLALLPPRRPSWLILAYLVPMVGSLANFPVILWKYTAPVNPLFFCLGAAALVGSSTNPIPSPPSQREICGN